MVAGGVSSAPAWGASTREANTVNMNRLPNPGERIHFIGIGGAGNSALARLLHQWGHRVSGSDAERSALTDALAAEGLTVNIGHAAKHVGGAALVVRSAAVPEANVELLAAHQAQIPIVKRAELLGLIANARTSIAVAGTHGKSTTSAMVAKICRDAGTDPSFVIGATMRDFGTNAHAGNGDSIVIEADEYDRSFLQLRPRIALVTNIEADHPDIYPTLADVDEAFLCFARGIGPGGSLLFCADNPGCQRLARRLPAQWDVKAISYGEQADADWRFAADGTVLGPAGGSRLSLHLTVPGSHNRLNALGAVATATAVGIDPDIAIESLNGFSGIERRFEVKGEVGGIIVVDDYAHHPTEVSATIHAARERYWGRPVWAVFQPHTFSRTKLLSREFAEALDAADRVVLLDVYAAREPDNGAVSADDIGRQLVRPPSRAGGPDDAADVLLRAMRDGDLAPGALVLLLGAGDVWRVGARLLDDRAR